MKERVLRSQMGKISRRFQWVFFSSILSTYEKEESMLTLYEACMFLKCESHNVRITKMSL